jgi:hypothetical protein
VSASGADQDYADALLVTCELTGGGCTQPPGEPCINVVTKGPRDEPHYNRVVRGRLANRGEGS